VVIDFARFFVPEVAEHLRQTETAPRTGQGVRREAAILSIDLRGFTRLARDLPPTELMALLGEYQSRFVPVIQRHGGKVDKYLGDGILASFGAINPNGTYAADLCRTVEELALAAEAWASERSRRGLPTPLVGMAGAAGDVVFGTVGHETRLEYTVIGEAVNLAAKLEKHTKREGVPVLLTRRTFDRAVAQGYRPQWPVEDKPGRAVDGIDDPVDLITFAPA